MALRDIKLTQTGDLFNYFFHHNPLGGDEIPLIVDPYEANVS